jgi:hypothetical protein
MKLVVGLVALSELRSYLLVSVLISLNIFAFDDPSLIKVFDPSLFKIGEKSLGFLTFCKGGSFSVESKFKTLYFSTLNEGLFWESPLSLE